MVLCCEGLLPPCLCTRSCRRAMPAPSGPGLRPTGKKEQTSKQNILSRPRTICPEGSTILCAAVCACLPARGQAIQILIGLMHIGFGAVSLVTAIYQYFIPLAAIVGYHFWGGVLVRCSVGFNITSAVIAAVGIILYIVEMAVNDIAYLFSHQDEWVVSAHVNAGLSIILLLFSILEFCITVPLAHFGCQASCFDSNLPWFTCPALPLEKARLPPKAPLLLLRPTLPRQSEEPSGEAMASITPAVPASQLSAKE